MTTDHEFDLTDGYQHDPDRDIAALVQAFFDHLPLTPAERDAATARHAELQTEFQHLNVDQAAVYNVRMTTALTAAYERLRPRLGAEQAVELIREAFVVPLGPQLQQATRQMLDAAEDPFLAMVAVSKSRETDAFGIGFTFERPVDNQDEYQLDVRRCHYYDTLVATGTPELAPAMCDFDTNWIEAIDPAKDGFTFDRETTIGFGGTHCPFHFRRTPPS
jgi:hypothetical protein